MEAFTTLTSHVIPLDRSNVDTDAIIPKQYLKSVRKSGFGVNLFDDWRYLDPGEPDQDHSQRRLNPDFVLNHHHYKDAKIVLSRHNFGCGSSREHAVWAKLDYGIRAVIANSFADIFHSNCLKNGLLPIVLPEETVEALFQESFSNPGHLISINLEQQRVTSEQGIEGTFDIDQFRKYCMLNGLDEIGITLQHEDKIRVHEEKLKKTHPWLFQHD
ncbi:MAG: 3-isopropylmalate dehydratase small subunit [Pseudomonadota bacterium]